MKYITDLSGLYEVYYILPGKSLIGIDCEFTDADNVHASKLLLVSLTVEHNNQLETFVIDLTVLSIGSVFDILRAFLEDKTITKIGHNITADWKQIYHHTKIMIVNMHDTMIVDRMIYAGLHPLGLKGKPFSYASVVWRRLGIELAKEFQKSFMEWTEGTIFTKEQIEYAGYDTQHLIDIYKQQIDEINKLGLYKIYNEVEMPIIVPTAMMEYTGVPINAEKLSALKSPFIRFVNAAYKALQDMFISGGVAEKILFSRDGYVTVKPTGRDQKIDAFERLGINPTNRQGKPSLAAKDVIRWDMLWSKKNKINEGFNEIDYHTVISDDEVANALIAYTGLNNPYLRANAFYNGARILFSTFIEGILEKINPITKRIHPYFNSYGAMATGRYSSNSPNFQNLPNDRKLKALGLGQYSIRQCIEAPPGRKLIICDYPSIELAILAICSGDEKLIELLFAGDIHAYVAKNVLGCADITKENKKKFPYELWRDAAKRLSFAIAYGTTGMNISEVLTIVLGPLDLKFSMKDGEALIEKWFAMFPKAHTYLKGNAKKAVSQGFVTDVWGRRRNWDKDFLVANKWKRLAAEREGMNQPIQATSATMTKLAIRFFWEKANYKKARIIITVHDEIVVEATNDYAAEAASILKWAAEESIRLTLPSIADMVGKDESLSIIPAISDKYDK